MTTVLGHLTERLVETVAENETNRRRSIALTNVEPLAPVSVRSVRAAKIEIILLVDVADLVIPGVVALDLEHNELAERDIFDDTLRQLLLG